MKSPKPKTKEENVVQTLNFNDMIHELLDGKYAKRASWEDPNTFIFIKDDLLSLSVNGKVTGIILHVSDFTSTDWVIVK